MTTILIRDLQNQHLLTQPEHDGDPMTVSDMLPDTSPLTKQSLIGMIKLRWTWGLSIGME